MEMATNPEKAPAAAHEQLPLPLANPPEHAATERAALVGRWLLLVRETLPGMATRHAWPVSLDHCFMRICLDTALGRPWHTVVRRPAIRHLSDGQLATAIAVAEAIMIRPETLVPLNCQSIAWRNALRRA